MGLKGVNLIGPWYLCFLEGGDGLPIPIIYARLAKKTLSQHTTEAYPSVKRRKFDTTEIRRLPSAVGWPNFIEFARIARTAM